MNITLTENELRNLIREEIDDIRFVESLPEIDKDKLNEYLNRIYPQSINEMSKLNVKDFSYFPYNKFDIRIWSNDHNPPHFHVMTNDGWNIVIDIESGKVLKTESVGKDSKIYSYVERNIGKWLSQKYKGRKKINMTNQDMAFEVWELNNGF